MKRVLRGLTLAAALGACAEPEPAAEAPPTDVGADLAEPASPPATERAQAGDSGRIVGLYVLLPDGAILTECGSDRMLTVRSGAAAAELDQTYRLQRSGEGAPVLAVVEGVVTPGAAAAAAGAGRLRVDRVDSVDGAATCPGLRAQLPLEGLRWRLEGLPEPSDEVTRAGAWLVLDRDTKQVGGFTGCRDLSGTYEWQGTRLRFGSLDLQGGMCASAGVHEMFLEALRVTGSYRIMGTTLELMGESGPVARLRGPRPR